MKTLVAELKKHKRSHVRNRIEQRIKDFSAIQHTGNDVWFSELCFCLLTANSKAKTAIAIQQEIGNGGFHRLDLVQLTEVIRKNKHRFHNNKARFIVEARKHADVKKIIHSNIDKHGLDEARGWLVENVKGLGMKEASHFMRNVGFDHFAILDRHVLNLMHEHKIITRPKTLSKKNYILFEKKVRELAKAAGMTMTELDLYLWYMKTGEVLK